MRLYVVWLASILNVLDLDTGRLNVLTATKFLTLKEIVIRYYPNES